MHPISPYQLLVASKSVVLFVQSTAFFVNGHFGQRSNLIYFSNFCGKEAEINIDYEFMSKDF